MKEREEAAFRETLIADVEAAPTPHEAVRRLLLGVAERLERHPFLRLLLEPGTLDVLLLRLPAERVEAHRRDDEAFFLSLARRWKRRGWLGKHVSPQRVFDVLGALFVLSTQAPLLGEEATRRAAEEIAAAVADRWCGQA